MRLPVDPGKRIPIVYDVICPCAVARIDEIMAGISAAKHVPVSARAAEDDTVVLRPSYHAAVCAQSYAIHQRAWKILIEVRPIQPVVRRADNASIVAIVDDARNCVRKG